MRRLLPLAGLLLLACRGPGPAHPSPRPAPEVWVDASAPAGGTGTRQQPLRTLAAALARGEGVRVRLAAGRYPGPHRVPPGAWVRGGAGAVLLGGVEAPGGATLEELTLEGGEWCLRGGGAVGLRDVALVGGRLGGLKLHTGLLRAERLQVRAGADPVRTVGLSLDGPLQAELQALSVQGDFRRGLEVAGGAEVHLEDLRVVGPQTALHQLGGRVRLRRGAVGGGRGPGLFVAGGELQLRDVVVLGHEYGLQAGRQARVQAQGLASLGAAVAGVALVGVRAHLEDVQVLEAGNSGALQFISSEVTLRGFGVQDAAAYGLVASASSLRASEGHLVRTRASDPVLGDALHLRRGEVQLRALRVRGASGLGLLAAEGARVRAQDLVLEGCAGGGAVAETRAQLDLRGLRVLGGAPPAVGVTSGAGARLEVVHAPQSTPLLWADCPQGARVELGFGFARGEHLLSAPCVMAPAQ